MSKTEGSTNDYQKLVDKTNTITTVHRLRTTKTVHYRMKKKIDMKVQKKKTVRG